VAGDRAARDEIKYFAEHRGGQFYIRTNDGAKEFRVVAAPVASPGVENWKEFIPGEAGVTIQGFEVFADHAVVVERAEGLVRFRLTDYENKNSKRVELPEPAYLASSEFNAEFATPIFRFRYESPITPQSIFAYDIGTGEKKLLKQTEVLGGYDPARYVVERVRATAKDGRQIPLDIVRKKTCRWMAARPRGFTGTARTASRLIRRFPLVEFRCSIAA
jgi:oligopeptidase B